LPGPSRHPAPPEPVFITRRNRSSSRFTIWKVALLFLGAGIWIAGIIVENYQITAAAIIVVTIGLLLGLVERRKDDEEAAFEDGDEPDEDQDEPHEQWQDTS